MNKLVDKIKVKARKSFEENIKKPIIENCEQGKNRKKYLKYLSFYKLILFCFQIGSSKGLYYDIFKIIFFYIRFKV